MLKTPLRYFDKYGKILPRAREGSIRIIFSYPLFGRGERGPHDVLPKGGFKLTPNVGIKDDRLI